jgi:hypothetical protein|nr:hypothetical protein [uncultured Streptococcus sp.]
MKAIRQNRFWIIYGVCAALIILVSIPISNRFIKLKNINDFVGDVLNFSSIMTGFLGAMLGILASISKSTAIMKTIFETKRAKLQLILSIIVPFAVGMVNIIVCAFYRLFLSNCLDVKILSFLFWSSTLFFLVSSILMVVLIFIFYFFENDKIDNTMMKPQK